MKKRQIHNLIILDESGSMESIKSQVISGFNETVQTIKGSKKLFPEQEQFITVVSFNGLGNKLLHYNDEVKNLKQLNDHLYNPDAMTPLFDAIGFAINKMKKVLKHQKDSNVLVTIFTDGEENASREYTGNQVKTMIEKLKNENWTFTYIGTDHDVEKIAINLSITNTLSFEKNSEGISEMFVKERNARNNYYKKVSSNKDTKSNYFDEVDNDDGKLNR